MEDLDDTAAGNADPADLAGCARHVDAQEATYTIGGSIGDTDGLVKLLFHRETRRLLATHLICERATELIHIGQAVMRLGGGIDYFLETVMTYPSLSEAYKQAAYDAVSQLDRDQRPRPLA